MYTIAIPRQMGKSHFAVTYAARTGAVIVCANTGSAIRLKQIAESQGVTIKDPILHSAFLNKSKLVGRPKEKYIIDDAEFLVEKILRSVSPDSELIGCIMTGFQPSSSSGPLSPDELQRNQDPY